MSARSITFGLVLLFTMMVQEGISSRVLRQDILVVIYAPVPGQAVQGQVPIDVGIVAPGYTRVEVEFAYSDQAAKTWFLVAETNQIPFDGVLAQWDTAVITDGDYDLRMVVTKNDGESIIYDVPGLRVRNYTPIETDTPAPLQPTETLLPGQRTPELSSTATNQPSTVTPFSTNPAIFTESQLIEGASLGGTIVLVFFIILLIYFGVSTYLRNRG